MTLPNLFNSSCKAEFHLSIIEYRIHSNSVQHDCLKEKKTKRTNILKPSPSLLILKIILLNFMYIISLRH